MKIAMPKHIYAQFRRLSKEQKRLFVDELLRFEITVAMSLANGHKVLAQRIWYTTDIDIPLDPEIFKKHNKALGRFAPGVSRDIRLLALNEYDKTGRLRKLLSEASWL